MGDLTIATAPTCETNFGWSTEVTGSKGAVYNVRWCFQPGGSVQYDYECTCPSFTHRREHCKHILRVIEKHLRCGWNEALEPGLETGPNSTCPKCGSEVKFVRVGV